MNKIITLTAGLGSDLGPNFNLTANVGSVSPSTATKTELLAGKTVTLDNSATQVTITSTGSCLNSLILNFTAGTTTTTTTEAPASIIVENTNTDFVAQGIEVQSFWATGFSSPSAGNNSTCYTTHTGTVQVIVDMNSGTPSVGFITFTDSNGTAQCINFTGGYGHTFTGCVVNNVTPCHVLFELGSC